jgi:hypothetical protein
MVYELNSEELKLRSSVIGRYYMRPIVEEIDSYIATHGELEAFNYVHDVLRASQQKVETLLQGRKDDGEISDVSHDRQSKVRCPLVKISYQSVCGAPLCQQEIQRTIPFSDKSFISLGDISILHS